MTKLQTLILEIVKEYQKLTSPKKSLKIEFLLDCLENDAPENEIKTTVMSLLDNGKLKIALDWGLTVVP